MKKFIFGCVLMICGTVIGSSWLIAYTSLIKPGAWTSFFPIITTIGFNRVEGYIIVISYLLAIVGTIIAIKSMRDDKKKDK